MLFAKQLKRNIEAILIVTYMYQVKDCLFLVLRHQHVFSININYMIAAIYMSHEFIYVVQKTLC